MRYSHEELVSAYIRDLELDAEIAEEDVRNGRSDHDWASFAVKNRAEIAALKSAASVRIDNYGMPYVAASVDAEPA
jgi:hypothetical protein